MLTPISRQIICCIWVLLPGITAGAMSLVCLPDSIPPPAPLLFANDSFLCPGQHFTLSVFNLPAPCRVLLFSGRDTIRAEAPSSVYRFKLRSEEKATRYEAAYIEPLSGQLSKKSVPVQIRFEIAEKPVLHLRGDTLFAVKVWTSYQWRYNQQPIPGANKDFWMPRQDGHYALEVQSLNGCVYQSDDFEDLHLDTLPEGVLFLKLSPNPTDGQLVLEIRFEKTTRCDLYLLDSKGNQIFRQTHDEQAFILPVDLRAAAAGVYILHVEMAGGGFVRRVIKY